MWFELMIEFTDEEISRAQRMFKNIFGPDYGAELCNQLDDGDFNKILMCRIAPEVWELHGADLRTKILCVIAVCTAQKLDLSYFIRAALFHEISIEEIESVILLAGLESGFPAAGVARRQIDAACQAHESMLVAKAT